MFATEIEKLALRSMVMLSDEDDMSDDGDVDKKDELDEDSDATPTDNDDPKLDEEETEESADGLEE